MRYTEDKIINRSAPGYPGPWIAKQRVYQRKSNIDKNWFNVEELVYDSENKIVPSYFFLITSGLFGTREWLQLEEDEPILYVKNFNKFY